MIINHKYKYPSQYFSCSSNTFIVIITKDHVITKHSSTDHQINLWVSTYIMTLRTHFHHFTSWSSKGTLMISKSNPNDHQLIPLIWQNWFFFHKRNTQAIHTPRYSALASPFGAVSIIMGSNLIAAVAHPHAWLVLNSPLNPRLHSLSSSFSYGHWGWMYLNMVWQYTSKVSLQIDCCVTHLLANHILKLMLDWNHRT